MIGYFWVLTDGLPELAEMDWTGKVCFRVMGAGVST